ncbi:MAG: NF038122 family metalloprotease [Phormidesmis sp.]
MVQFKFTYDPSIALEQRVGFELAAMIWSSYLTDDVTVNLHIASSDSLGEDGQAIGGAIPILHAQNYGVYQEYAEADATSDVDASAIEHLQDGNTVDFLVDGQVVDGNTNILLTSAQAKALGMDEALSLENGGTWDRDLVDANALDGYILVSNAFDWNYDYARNGEAPEGTLDFMSMALHEIGHQLGFVSGLDGALNLTELYSGDTQAEGFTALDLFRHSLESGELLNPDGAVSDLTRGQNSYFSVDGGQTNLGNFSDGVDYQASHWERLQMAMGIMDPTLAYQERTSLGLLDLQALDALGWDINYNALDMGLDLDSLLQQAEQAVSEDLGFASTLLTENRSDEENSVVYTLGYGELWQLFEKSMFSLGYGELWSVFELGYGELWQEYGKGIFKLGYGELWQLIEENIFELGYGELWQQFEAEMLELGYGELWQQFETEMLELGYGELWQKLDKTFSTLQQGNGNNLKNQREASGGVRGKTARVHQGGENDDIIAGGTKQDRINAGAGDDLIDGKAGHDVIWGGAGDDVIYGQDGNDLIYGGEDDDLLLGEADDDNLHGDAGDDIVSGGSGNDVITGGEGKDDLKGNWGHDVIYGGADGDRIAGETGRDILIGGSGGDQIRGGDGDDVIYGDAYEDNKTLNQLRTELKALAKANGDDSDDAPPPPTTNPLNPVRVEAESMTLTGDAYIHTAWSNDSGDSVRTTGTSTATTTFSGQSGSYMLVARYFDAVGGSGKLSFDLNGVALNSFNLDQDTNRYYTQTVFQDLNLNAGDELTVTAVGEGTDEAALDYLEFIPLDSLLSASPGQTASTSTPAQSTTEASGSSSLLGGIVDTSLSLLMLPLTLFSPAPQKTKTPTPAETPTTEIDSSTLRVEAESMMLVGDYYTENNNSASGGSLIAVNSQGEGKALSKFSGESGYYNIVVGYYDESGDGIGKISTSLDGKVLDTWWLDQALSSEQNANAQSFKTRAVASAVFLENGDIFELTGLRGEGNEDELARIDYVDFVEVDLEDDGDTQMGALPETVPAMIEPIEPVILGGAIRVEAESMRLEGYGVERHHDPSGGRVIKTNSNGAATAQFSGETGYYNIVVTYYDENDGRSSLSASLNGTELDAWQLDQNLGSNYISSNNRVMRTVATQMKVNTGDELSLRGIRQNGEFARIDYVEFVPVSAAVVVTPAAKTGNNDFLQGGSGNDIVVGGIGNDSLYGDSGNDALYGDTREGSDTLSRSLVNGLVGHWALDEASGLNTKDSAKGNTGTLVNANWTSGKIGGALDFDGTQEKVLVADTNELDLTQTLTLSTWIKADAFKDGAGLITKGTSKVTYALEVNSDGKLTFNTNDGFYKTTTSWFGFFSNTVSKQQTFTSDSGLTLNQWHHVAVTYDGENVQFYIDGQLDGSTQASVSLESSNESLVFGADVKDGTYFDGELDDIRVYDRALSVEELLALSKSESGNDFIVGGIGSDTLEGGSGNDVLDGTDVIAAGYFEKDVLSGGLGADIFIVGNADQSYYLGGGMEDYATITDFNAFEDMIQLHGSASDYSQQQQGDDTYLYAQGDDAELVAVLKNTSSVDFERGFSFV